MDEAGKQLFQHLAGDSVRKIFPALAFFLFFPLLCVGQTLPAFPGAQAGGALSVGGSGRNGTGTARVFEVTTLADSGSGSLRSCVEASGPRTCVFRLAGLITSKSRLACTSPYLTIAGQTAPGGGITLGGPGQSGEQLDIQCHDVIVRFLSYDGIGRTGPDGGTVGFEEANGGGDVYNVMFDHLSSKRMGNKILIYANDSSGNQHVKNSSWQWMLIYEPNTAHPVGPGYFSVAYPNENYNNDLHHSIMMNEGHRLPLNTSQQNWRLVSNYTYNWDYFAINMDGTNADIIDNYWDQTGNLNSGNSNPHPLNATLGNGSGSGNCLSNCDVGGTPSVYMSGNICTQFGTDYQCSAEEAGNDPEGFPEVATPIRPSWQRHSPLQAETIPIIPDAASTLKSKLAGTLSQLGPIGAWARLDSHGNPVDNRTTDDTRILKQLINGGSGGQFGGPGYNGPSTTPTIPTGTPCVSSLHDGICDDWKTDQGLSLTDGTLFRQTAPNGYTYLENFLNSSFGTNVATGGGGGTNTNPPPTSGAPDAPTNLVAVPH
jgi:hypothetical protein